MDEPVNSRIFFHPLPSVMLVGLQEDLAENLPDLPVEVLLARSAESAERKMKVRRPLAVYVGNALTALDFALVCKTAEEIGADVVRIPREILVAELGDWLEAALFARQPNPERALGGAKKEAQNG